MTVETEFGVVVVLDDHRVASGGPGDQSGTAVGRKHRAGRVLVCRGDDDRIDGDVLEGVHPEPGIVQRDADQLEPRGTDDGLGVVERGVLDRHPARSVRPERRCHESDRLAEAVRDDDVVRVDGGTARPVEIGRECAAQFGDAMAVEVAEALAWRRLEGTSHRSKPGPARKLVQIGTARTQVDLDGGRWVASGSGTGRDRRVCDRRRPTRASVQVALGDQLVICLDHDAARDAELSREGA